MIKRVWDWIKTHTAWLAGGIVALGVAWYLLTHAGGSGGGSTTISYPASGGGGSVGGGGGIAPPSGGSTPATAALPFSPDFGILGSIKDAALRDLYSQEYNLETQINQATLTNNTSLLTTLQGALNSIQQQIANYQPAPTPQSTPTLTGWITTAATNLLPGQGNNWAELVAWLNGTQSSVSSGAAQLWQELINTYGIPIGFQGLNPPISVPTPTPGPGPGPSPIPPGPLPPSWTVPNVTQGTIDTLVSDYQAILAKYGSVSSDQ